MQFPLLAYGLLIVVKLLLKRASMVSVKHRLVKTTCAYCGVGCGVNAIIRDGEKRNIGINGSPEHPANHGRLCAKGYALNETIGLESRLLTPSVFGRETNWSEAVSTVAQRFLAIKEKYGPQAIAFYVSGQLLTEDYYVANKLIKGFIGSSNIDTNSRLCMASSVAAHKRAFGEDLVPACYEDIDHADLIILIGSNTAWCHPVVYQRIKDAKRKNGGLKIINIDPRVTASNELCDLHLQIKPGTDSFLFNGLLRYLFECENFDECYINSHTKGFKEAVDCAINDAKSQDAVANICGISKDNLKQFYLWFSRSKKTLSLYSQGINQSSSGTDKVNAIINCHLATGKIGKVGSSPFSLTGQPNAMGGREVGAFANTLAAHLDFSEAHCDKLQQFWGSPNIARNPGLKALELFEAVASGKVIALWIMATNPAVSMPNGKLVREALESCEFLVVSDCIKNTATTRYADVLLPALAWGEKSGTVTNSERRISRQRAFLPAPGKAKADWEIVCDVANAMGFNDAFTYSKPLEIFKEHCLVTGLASRINLQQLNLEPLATINNQEYEEFAPIQWPVKDGMKGTQRLFSDGVFPRPEGKARFVPVAAKTHQAKLDSKYSLILNTGRVRDQWHTMTRTGLSPRLLFHRASHYVDLHPDLANARKIREGDWVEISSTLATQHYKARITTELEPNSIFIPMHSSELMGPSFGVANLIPSVFDPHSGQPELKQIAVSVKKVSCSWHAFILSKTLPNLDPIDYYSITKLDGYYQIDCAGIEDLSDEASYYCWLNKVVSGDMEITTFRNSSASLFRSVGQQDNCLHTSVVLGKEPILADTSWLRKKFELENFTNKLCFQLLANHPPKPEINGDIICACFGVGRDAIRYQASRENSSVEAIEKILGAGAKCGTCIPEIKTELDKYHLEIEQG